MGFCPVLPWPICSLFPRFSVFSSAEKTVSNSCCTWAHVESQTQKMLCVVCSSFSGSSRSLGISGFPKTKSVGANGRRPVPTESWPGSSPGPRISCQRGASKAEAVALAGAETRGKAEKRAVGWAGGAEWGTCQIFPFG